MSRKARVALLRFSRDLTVNFATPGAAEMFQSDMATLPGATIDELPLLPDEREHLRQALIATRDGGEEHAITFSLTSARDTRHCQVVVTPGSEKPVSQLWAVFQEIDDRQRAPGRQRDQESAPGNPGRDDPEQPRLSEELARRNQELLSLYEAGAALGNSLDLRELYWTLFREVGQTLLKSPHFVVALYNDETQEISCQFAIVDGKEVPAETFPVMQLGEGPTSEAIRTREIQHVDMEARRALLKQQGRLAHVGDERLTMSGLYLPLVSGDRIRGVLSVQSYEPNAYEGFNRQLLSTIAAHAAVALQNGLMFQEIQSYTHDLEQRVRARTQELEWVNKRLFAILNSANDGILLLNQNGAIELANRAFDTLLGCEPGELLGHTLDSITLEAHASDVERALEQVRVDGQPQRLHLKCLRQNHTTFDGELSLSPVARHAGHEGYLVGTLFDISALKAVEQMKNQFVSTINHEVRTPVTGIVLSADALHKYYQHLSDAQRLRKIGQIRQQGRVLVELVNDILDLARLDARQTKRGTELMNVSEIVTTVCNEMRPEAQARGQALTLYCREDQIQLIGTPADLARIWRHLIGNAIKYSDAGDAIIVTLDVNESDEIELPPGREAKAKAYIVGQVADNGRGIDEADAARIFDRFERGWARSSQISGTGMGLTIVRQLLDLYDGDIMIESEPGRGSRFTFWIPAG